MKAPHLAASEGVSSTRRFITSLPLWMRLCLAVAVHVSAAFGIPACRADEPVFGQTEHFDQTIAPLLAARCLECHSGSAAEGGLDLSTRQGMLEGGDSGPAISRDQPDSSLLWQRIAQDEMPPEHPLGAQERVVLRRWLQAGAAWGTDPINRFAFTTDRRAGYDWWSLRPYRQVDVPNEGSSRNLHWCRTPLDRFVLARLERAGLEPSPEASPRVLVRRLYFDLIGLPPPPEVVEQYCAAPTDAAYAELVDTLLASPHYGERWARHWLDVVRFGESDGFERNTPREHAWPYRDWVIAAFNDDLPYDAFVRRQLAGDILIGGRDGAAATGFLVAGVHNTVVGQSERMKRLARQDELEEIVGTIGQTFLGLTVNCARCHDHKFDPISSEEYYAMIAAIDGVRHGEREIPVPDIQQQLADVSQQIQLLASELETINMAARKAILAERRSAENPPAPEVPAPLAHWDFETDLRDSLGTLHGTAYGAAELRDGALVVNGRDAYVQTEPLTRRLGARTLAAWVQLDQLDQRGGGVISIETRDGAVFDAIVFGEREPRHWMAGSNGFARTKSFQGPPEETAASQPVHLAITYAQDGTIRCFRNGAPYGRPYETGFVTYAPESAHLVFGLRHLPAGGNRLLSGRVLSASLFDSALDPEAVAALAGQQSDFVTEDAIRAWLPPERRHRREELVARLDAARMRRESLEAQATRKLYTIVPDQEPEPMRVHIRGSVTNFGSEVAPAGLQAVHGGVSDWALNVDASDAERRRRLAEWITHPDNALFARVLVNRVWHYHFGTGIVETPNDLGFNGGRPSHPELLDWLAWQFREEGFRIKPLHRHIVLSATYRQSSQPTPAGQNQDAGNRLLWRMSPRRLEAEAVRDAMLTVAGVLNTEAGGPGFRDVSVTYNSGTTYYEPIDPPGPEFARRTVYRFTPRGGRSAVLDTFDCPDPSSTAPRRSVTTTPLQALSLMNNSFVLRMSQLFAERVRREVDREASASRHIHRAWQIALGRPPTPAEHRLSARLVESHGLAVLCRGLFNCNEFIVIE